MTLDYLAADVAMVRRLLDADPNERTRYVDVMRDIGHVRAGAALAELEGAGEIDWHTNGRIYRRRRAVS
jgi:hypothetical protein